MRGHRLPIIDAFGLLALGRPEPGDPPPPDEHDPQLWRRLDRPRGWSETRRRMRSDLRGGLDT